MRGNENEDASLLDLIRLVVGEIRIPVLLVYWKGDLKTVRGGGVTEVLLVQLFNNSCRRGREVRRRPTLWENVKYCVFLASQSSQDQAHDVRNVILF